MNPDIKDAWMEALNSEQYPQATDTLVRADEYGKPGYCCLGVLTDLYIKAGHTDIIYDPTQFVFKVKNKPDATAWGMPPSQVYEWAELDEQDAGFLAEMNDAGTPFPAISVYVGRHL